MSEMEQQFGDFLRARGVDVPCRKCSGLGTITYGNTSTWCGGIGGQMFTTGVCDKCWGTGDENRHGADLRALHAQLNANKQHDSVEFLANRAGAYLSNCHGAIEEICQLLESASKPTRRKPRPAGFDSVCTALIATLRDGVSEAKRRSQKCNQKQ